MARARPHLACHRMLGAAAFMICAAPALAQATGVVAGPWVNVHGADVRLLLPGSATAEQKGPRLAGVEVRLPPGAKTYWRSPGETGVAPTFNFSGSEGLAEVEALYAAPAAFDDGAGGVAYGYVGGTVFPIRFQQTQPKATLGVTLDFGICTRNMCVPATAKLTGSPGLGTPDRGAEERLAEAARKVPAPQAMTASGPLALEAVALRSEGDRQIATIDVRAPEGSEPALFIESDEPFAHPRREPRAGGWRFTAERTRPAPGKPEGEARFTIVTSKAAVETNLPLEKLASK